MQGAYASRKLYTIAGLRMRIERLFYSGHARTACILLEFLVLRDASYQDVQGLVWPENLIHRSSCACSTGIIGNSLARQPIKNIMASPPPELSSLEHIPARSA